MDKELASKDEIIVIIPTEQSEDKRIAIVRKGSDMEAKLLSSDNYLRHGTLTDWIYELRWSIRCNINPTFLPNRYY